MYIYIYTYVGVIRQIYFASKLRCQSNVATRSKSLNTCIGHSKRQLETYVDIYTKRGGLCRTLLWQMGG